MLHYLSARDTIPASVYERAQSPIVKEWIEYIDNTIIPMFYLKIDSNEEWIADYFSYLSEFNKFKALGLTGTPINVSCGVMFHNQCNQIRHKYSVMVCLLFYYIVFCIIFFCTVLLIF